MTSTALVVVLTDTAGTVVTWSAAAARRSGVPAALACGRPLLALSPLRHEARCIAAALAPGTVPGPLDLAWRDARGRRRVLRFEVSRLEPDAARSGRALLLWVGRDLGEHTLAGALVRSAAEAIFAHDAEGRIVGWNDAAAAMFGWSREEILGEPLDVLIPEPQREAHRQAVRDSLASAALGRPRGTRRYVFGRRRDGRTFPAEVGIARFEIDGAAFCSAIVRDIGDRLRTEHRLRLLAEASERFGRDLCRQRIGDMLVEIAARHLADVALLYRYDGTAVHVHVDSRLPTTGTFCDRVRAVRLTDPQPFGTLLASCRESSLEVDVDPAWFGRYVDDREHAEVLRSVSAAKAVFLALDRSPRRWTVLVLLSGQRAPFGASERLLAEGLAQRAAQALENALLMEAAEHTRRQREAVLAVVAHDLRSPLSAIANATLLLRHENGAGRERILDVLDHSTRRMTRLVEDLLDETSIEAGRLRLDRADVPADQLLEQCAGEASRVASLGLALRVSRDPTLPAIRADALRLAQVLANLIDNAVKFVGPGGTITIDARAHGRDVLFSVHDDGPGIAAEDVHRAFAPYWQRGAEHGGGAGLGLSIARGIVEGHGGRIWVESTPGAGATFRFTIPAAHRTSA